jgi:anion-transporting  ArsA/GET3 family ATPase
MKTENRNKRVVFTMGGKGGVGKTGLMVALAEWFEAHEISVYAARPRYREQSSRIAEALLQWLCH